MRQKAKNNGQFTRNCPFVSIFTKKDILKFMLDVFER